MEKKVLIGLSTAEHIRRSDFLPSFLGIQRPDNALIITVHGQSPAKARNIIIENALKAECTHILFLDDDIIVPPDTLMKLLNRDKDIVSALYLLRGFPHQPAMFDMAGLDGRCRYSKLTDQKPKLEKIVNCGLGCVLISTEVFKKLEQPWVRLGEIEQDGWCDDVGFFNRCRYAGFDIYCDLNAPVGHMNVVTMWPEFYDGQWYTNYRFQGGNVRFLQDVTQPEASDTTMPVNERTLVEG